MAQIQGTCDGRLGPVREALAASLAAQAVGASVAVYLEGEPVVGLWGGHADAQRTRPWERDTVTGRVLARFRGGGQGKTAGATRTRPHIRPTDPAPTAAHRTALREGALGDDRGLSTILAAYAGLKS
jgi:hypothetical protein